MLFDLYHWMRVNVRILQKSSPAEPEEGPRLIISTGDISDVDGFFALAEYSKVRWILQTLKIQVLNLQVHQIQYANFHLVWLCLVFLVHMLDPKTGADVIFVMNYPAYVGVENLDESYDIYHPGLGYKYTSDQVSILKYQVAVWQIVSVCSLLHCFHGLFVWNSYAWQVFNSVRDPAPTNYQEFLKRYA